ncbi:DNA-binding protein [Stenotrophomonas maltophilia]|nr:DNA-binding protein [Stenotrophomonas maltophilia]MBA0412719.1 DNA-binding protein [Stenotrophomonas maltophilia]MBA0496214.1 DNA-binding protein [Stenotrophomonas maltophilia]MBA0500794.1 DNA-binding protein [Stenotrophomonas maltophilia]MBA0506255.1 DNA-binding protein [Stenotrophomonas maltophilia]
MSRQFDATCPPPVRGLAAPDIKRLRDALNFIRMIFALILNSSAPRVRKWGQGAPYPKRWALKPLKIIADKGLPANV